MKGKLLYAVLTFVASASASSVYAGIDPTKMYAGGEITFPRIPGINAPIFNFGSLFNTSHTNSEPDNSTSSSNYTGSPFGPFTPFLNLIPGFNQLVPKNGQTNLPRFPSIESVISKIPGIGTKNITVPTINIPRSNGPYIPGVSEALTEARRHLQAALNITNDFSTGFRDVIQVALNGDNPVAGIRVILDTIARVYGTVAANCPLIIIGSRVFAEGIRLAGEVMTSLANIAVG
ncbi:uncharacterized protein LOC131671247 [Phymastichus coffea]|uniref:uncharacterized protein LOC131671247 n=1 Tax=Phymastichus coffea TaxID=108790 RepID=UPI00273BCE79|nr:uncharacterized protein LOC131671247 [Phymastichus coffea]